MFGPRQLMSELAKEQELEAAYVVSYHFAADCHYREGTRAP
jgi:hypothetical protein